MYKYTCHDDPSMAFGDNTSLNIIELLKSRWDKLHEEPDIFNYKIDKIQERIVDGKYLLLLNPERSTKRRIPDVIEQVCQPFDVDKFNFSKIKPKEVLFNIVKFDDDDASVIHSVVINQSPIKKYHSLLCPSVNQCLPQIVTEDSLNMVLEIMFLAQNRDLRIGFNSLLALASVNHLHYHLFLEGNTLPVETAKCKNVIGPLFFLENYPVPTFCFEVPSLQSINESCKHIFRLINYFQKECIAHNMFITRGMSTDGNKEVVRAIVWPRKSSAGTKHLAAFNIAVCELSGWFPIFNEETYDNLKSEDLETELRKWSWLGFKGLCDSLKSLY